MGETKLKNMLKNQDNNWDDLKKIYKEKRDILYDFADVLIPKMSDHQFEEKPRLSLEISATKQFKKTTDTKNKLLTENINVVDTVLIQFTWKSNKDGEVIAIKVTEIIKFKGKLNHSKACH